MDAASTPGLGNVKRQPLICDPRGSSLRPLEDSFHRFRSSEWPKIKPDGTSGTGMGPLVPPLGPMLAPMWDPVGNGTILEHLGGKTQTIFVSTAAAST